MNEKIKILILGVTGMLGHKLYTELEYGYPNRVYGTSRNLEQCHTNYFNDLITNIERGVDASELIKIQSLFDKIMPTIVINCIGLTKQVELAKTIIPNIEINSLFPHKVAELCSERNIRFIHISTDCVFKGDKGMYVEFDVSDAIDLYGRTKFIGEVDYGNHLTLRTSMIGHEINTSYSLLNWFLNQKDSCRGFEAAIFSGFPTVYLAQIIRDYIIPNEKLSGIYHLSSSPISKYNLLKIIAKVYKKIIHIEKDTKLKIDRSLDSSKFKKDTGFVSLDWLEMIEMMYNDSKKYV